MCLMQFGSAIGVGSGTRSNTIKIEMLQWLYTIVVSLFDRVHCKWLIVIFRQVKRANCSELPKLLKGSNTLVAVTRELITFDSLVESRHFVEQTIRRVFKIQYILLNSPNNLFLTLLSCRRNCIIMHVSGNLWLQQTVNAKCVFNNLVDQVVHILNQLLLIKGILRIVVGQF